MDLRFSYARLRDEIVKDVRARMHRHIDAIEEYEKQIKEIETKIMAERTALKDLATAWKV